jgi:hypothetical protein
MLSIGIQEHLYTVTPTLLGSECGVLGHMWSQNDVIRSWLRLTATSNCLPHPCQTCATCLSTLICRPLACRCNPTNTVLSTLLGLDRGILGHLSCQNDVIMSWLRLSDSHLNLLPSSILEINTVLNSLICCL